MPVIFEEAEIAGVNPIFVLRDEAMCDYFRDSGGAPEAPLIEWTAEMVALHPNPFFLDVGAHVGTYGVTLACKGFPTLAFEPQRNLARMCNWGFLLSDQPKLCIPAALADFRDDNTLMTAPYADGGGCSLVKEFENPAISTVVTVRQLDEFKLNPSFIKIDAEGAELSVLRGGEQTISTHKPKILLEVWEGSEEPVAKYLSDVLDYKLTPVSWKDTWLAEPR